MPTEEQPQKLTKSQLLAAFKEDLASADTLRLEMVAKVETWKKEYNGEPYGNEQKGKSKLVSRDIKRQDEWQHASIKDPFVSDPDIIKCHPVTYEDRKAAEQNELILNHQFTRQFNRYKFMTNVIKLYYSEGTVITKCSWEYEDEEVTEEIPIYAVDPITGQPTIIDTKTVKKLNVLVNRPDAEICRLEDIYLDPTSEGDIDKAQFIIHRYESDLSSLRKAGKYKNLDKVARALPGSDAREDYNEEDETEFTFKDQPRKKLLVHEYWGNYDIENTGIALPIVCTWVGDVIIQLESNPYPDQALPFLVLANNSIPFKMYGEANAELIGDNQKVTTAIKRGILDNMANSNNAQKGMRVNALSGLNRKRFLNGKNFEYNGTSADFYEGSYNAIPQSVFAVLQMVQAETESMLGVKSFSEGIAGKSLGSTAKAAGGVLDAVSVRRLDIVRNIAENLLKPLMRKWMSYNGRYLQEQEIVRITNEEFVPIKRDDLAGAVDIRIEVSTSEDNSAKAQELSFLLQTLGQGMDQGMKTLLMSQIAKLHKMPDLAKQMEEFKPQPDPFAEEMKRLEILKTKAEILERQSRAEENKVDMRLKTANAVLAEMKAIGVGSDTDLKDQEFVDNESGKSFGEEMIRKEHDRRTNLELKSIEKSKKH